MDSLYRIFLKHPHISTDSRSVAVGSIFFALKGASFDGNKFAVSALEQGAICAVVDDPRLMEGAYADKMILVDDVLCELQALAALYRREMAIPVLAITGSNGKTTTKELTYRVLSKRYNVSVTRGNFNNHIGVPLTLLSIARNAEFAVVEMGASSCGEIELLCNIAQPDFGLITNIGRAHLEGFGGLDGVRRGKGELFDYLVQHHGMAFYLDQNDDLAQMISSREGLLSKGYSIEAAKGLRHHLVGDYNLYNIAAAVAIGDYFGVHPSEIADAIASYMPDNHRSQRLYTQANTLILDCYNANPSSMGVAIDNLAGECDGTGRDKVVILGDMLELGEYSEHEHLAILEQATRSGVREIFLVGNRFRVALDRLREKEPEKVVVCAIHAFLSVDTLSNYLKRSPISNCMILIKGSHSMALEGLKEVL